MTDDALFSRDEVLGGLPARRAAALLFLIESRTAHLVDRARHAMTRFRSEDDERERELAFVEAFALGRKPPLRPGIQDLERHAAEWADLVPENPRMRAAVAHMLGEKYQFTVGNVPGIRAALGLDTASVQQAFTRLYNEPLDAIYTESLSVRARLRWVRASLASRLESLPPFWTTYSLTLTETVGSGILALPIAVALVGPIPAIAMLIVMGLINIITIAWVAESFARTASIRYSGAFFGRMVKEYMGVTGATLLTMAVLVTSIVGMLAYSVGISSTLADMTGVPDAGWLMLVFGATGLIIARGSMNASVASAIGIGGVNIVLLFILTTLGFLHLQPGNLSYMALPGMGGQPWDASLTELVFGTLLIAFFGHTSVGNCSAVVLRQDPGGRSLIRGVIAAQVTTIVICAIWILGINGALAPGMLADEAGTVLEPLADVAGSSVYIAGVLFVMLAMGLGITSTAGTLISVIRDWFPKRTHPVVILSQKQSRLVFESRRNDPAGNPGFALTYLGLSGDQPRFRLQGEAAGRTFRADYAGTGTWSAREAFTRLPADILAGKDLTISCLSATENQVRLQVTTTMKMRYEGNWATPGLDLASLIDLDVTDASHDADSDLLRWMLRQGKVSLSDAALWSGHPESTMQDRLRDLVERGAIRELQENGATVYRANMARRRARHVPDSLEPASTERASPSASEAIRTRIAQAVEWLHHDHRRSILEYTPLVAIALITEWLVINDHATFTELLSFSGTVAVPIFVGLFPPLLLMSSQRKGDLVPATISRHTGLPWIAAGVYLFFLLSMLLHGLFIWEHPVAQVLLVTSVVASLIVTILAIRRGALEGRTVVTLRDEPSSNANDEAVFEIVSRGLPAQADVQFVYRDGTRHTGGINQVIPNFRSLQNITIALPPDHEREIKIWANHVSAQGDLQGLSATVRLASGSSQQQIDLGLSGGTAILSCDRNPCIVEIEFDQLSAPEPVSSRTKSGRKRPVDVHALLTSTPSESGR